MSVFSGGAALPSLNIISVWCACRGNVQYSVSCWLLLSLLHQSELSQLLFPVFVHLYLGLVESGHTLEGEESRDVEEGIKGEKKLRGLGR